LNIFIIKEDGIRSLL